VNRPFSNVKPGWYLLALVTLYALVVSVLLFSRSSNTTDRPPASGQGSGDDQDTGASVGGETAPGPLQLWFPIPGSRLPASDNNLPSAPRAYRLGVSQGFDFVDGDVGVPVPYGAAVIAAADGQVVRADSGYAEMDPRAWESLLAEVGEAGANDEQLDALRGRQVWIRTPAGAVLRYGHLAGIRDGIGLGRAVQRGQVIGFVGNSGTDDGVAGRRERARLRFEVWQDGGSFLGDGLLPEEVRLAAASLFVGP